MKTKTFMSRTLIFFLALAMCVPMMLFALATPVSAASSQIGRNISTTACKGNLSDYNLPVSISTASTGQQLYVNVAATSDIKLKSIEVYVSINGGSYSLVGKETANNYMRWAYFPYKPNSTGTFTFLVKITHTNGSVQQGTSTITVSKASSMSLANIALAEVGTQGTGSNGKGTGDYTKYGKFTGTNGQAWCASFVSWCVSQAGVSTAVVPKTASCNTMKGNSNSYRKWSSSALNNIKKNDVIFFSTGSQDSHHVGIVYSVSGSNITVIEGNTSQDTVAKNTYTVNSSNGKITKGWSGHYFCGYISVK